MNFCYKTVFFALIFVFADILLLLLINKKQLTNNFAQSLDVEKKKYIKILFKKED